MGVQIQKIHSHFEFQRGAELPEVPRQVLSLAMKSLRPLVETGLPENLSHIVVATTCPDMLAPSLGQMINEHTSPLLSRCHNIDLVQGCAGGVSALILASQLSELNKSTVLVVQADAAAKASSRSDKIHKIFGNGSFACMVAHEETNKKLIHSRSQQYSGLSEVVTVKLGHDADVEIMRETKTMSNDPRKHLGLRMNNILATKLFQKAETFYLDFVRESEEPDIMILHQVNPLIMKHLKRVFSKYPMEFIDVSALTGNCGVASVGIALSQAYQRTLGKKILLCSFGTGGVITAGLWQN